MQLFRTELLLNMTVLRQWRVPHTWSMATPMPVSLLSDKLARNHLGSLATSRTSTGLTALQFAAPEVVTLLPVRSIPVQPPPVTLHHRATRLLLLVLAYPALVSLLLLVSRPRVHRSPQHLRHTRQHRLPTVKLRLLHRLIHLRRLGSRLPRPITVPRRPASAPPRLLSARRPLATVLPARRLAVDDTCPQLLQLLPSTHPPRLGGLLRAPSLTRRRPLISLARRLLRDTARLLRLIVQRLLASEFRSDKARSSRATVSLYQHQNFQINYKKESFTHDISELDDHLIFLTIRARFAPSIVSVFSNVCASLSHALFIILPRFT